MKLILKYICLLVFATSCTTGNKRLCLKERLFSDKNIGLYMYEVEPDEIESKMHKRIFYFFPQIKEKPTDLHMRVETSDGYSSCAIYMYQGDSVKVDNYYSMLLTEKRIEVRPAEAAPHKSTFREQMDILRYLTFICESEIGVKSFAHLIFSFDDLGEMNVEITELCDRIKKEKQNKEKGIFPLAMEKTVLAEELRTIYDQYDIEFIDYLWYDKNKVPYDKYADKHRIENKHNTPYVYIIDGFIVRLNKK